MINFPNNPRNRERHTELGTTWMYRDPPKAWQVVTGSGGSGGIIWLPEIDLTLADDSDVTIPEEATSIHVTLMEVSTWSTDGPCIQLGSGGVVEESGYTTNYYNPTAGSSTSYLGGLVMGSGHNGHDCSGNFTFRRGGNNLWQGGGEGIKTYNNNELSSFGWIVMPAPVDTVRITASFASTFDEGTAMVGYTL